VLNLATLISLFQELFAIWHVVYLGPVIKSYMHNKSSIGRMIKTQRKQRWALYFKSEGNLTFVRYFCHEFLRTVIWL